MAAASRVAHRYGSWSRSARNRQGRHRSRHCCYGGFDGGASSLYPGTMEDRSGSDHVAHRLGRWSRSARNRQAGRHRSRHSGADSLYPSTMEERRGGSRVAHRSMVAGAVALGIMNVATLAATAAQWLWNAAMLANPIGLIIPARDGDSSVGRCGISHRQALGHGQSISSSRRPDRLGGKLDSGREGQAHRREYFAGLSLFEAGKNLLMTSARSRSLPSLAGESHGSRLS